MKRADETPPDADVDGKDDRKALLASIVRELLDRHHVPERDRLSALQAASGLPYQQVRRRLSGENCWRLGELERIARHFDEPVYALFGQLSGLGNGAPAVLDAHGTRTPCRVWTGRPVAVAERIGPWVAVPDGSHQRWSVMPATTAGNLPAYEVRRLLIEPPPPTRLAIVDDETASGGELAHQLRQFGFDAACFESPAHLRDALARERFDAFVVDWIVPAEPDMAGFLVSLRADHPHAPILLLTGALDTGGVTESVIAEVLAHARAQLIEKPPRAFAVAATLQGLLPASGSAA